MLLTTTDLDTLPPTGHRSVEMIRELTGDPQIQIFRPNLQQLREETVVVKLRTKWYRAVKKLALADLGLDQASPAYKSAADQCQKLGNLTLLPTDTLNRIKANEVLARAAIRDNGFEHQWGGYLIPARLWPRVKAELEERRQAHLALGDEIADNLEALKGEQAERFRILARTALAANAGYPPAEAEHAPISREAIERYVEALMSLVPTPEAVRDSFQWTWEVNYLDVPRVLDNSLNLELLEREVLTRRTTLENLERQIQQRNQSVAEDLAYQKAQAELRDQEERLTLQREIFAEVQRTAAEARERELTGQFNEVAARVRTLLNTCCAEIAGAIEQRQGKVYGQQMDRLRRVAEQVAELNFFRDPEIDRLGALLKDLADTPPAERRDASFVDRLKDIERVTRGELLELARQSRGDLEIDLPDLALSDYRESRERLDTPVLAPAIEREIGAREVEPELAVAGREL